MSYIIKDWAGNHLFPEKTFDTFEDGWDFLYIHFANEEAEDFFEDFYVLEAKS